MTTAEIERLTAIIMIAWRKVAGPQGTPVEAWATIAAHAMLEAQR